MAVSRSFRIARERGAPISVGNRTLVPVALVMSARLAWRDRIGGAFAMARPLAMEVHEGSRVYSVRVPDLTLMVTIGTGLLGLALAAITSGIARSRRSGGAAQAEQ